MSDYEDDEEEARPICDWCDRNIKRPSLVMGYHHGDSHHFLWGKGDLICASCLKDVKPKLYVVKYAGRQIFATAAYYKKYWKDDTKVKVVRTPEIQAQDQSDDDDEGDASSSASIQETTNAVAVTTTEPAKKRNRSCRTPSPSKTRRVTMTPN